MFLLPFTYTPTVDTGPFRKESSAHAEGYCTTADSITPHNSGQVDRRCPPDLRTPIVATPIECGAHKRRACLDKVRAGDIRGFPREVDQNHRMSFPFLFFSYFFLLALGRSSLN